jgi:hypothetical protein
VYRSIDAAAAQQCRIGGVDNAVHRQRDNVSMVGTDESGHMPLIIS